jgi:hypothetical protein
VGAVDQPIENQIITRTIVGMHACIEEKLHDLKVFPPIFPLKQTNSFIPIYIFNYVFKTVKHVLCLEQKK